MVGIELFLVCALSMGCGFLIGREKGRQERSKIIENFNIAPKAILEHQAEKTDDVPIKWTDVPKSFTNAFWGDPEPKAPMSPETWSTIEKKGTRIVGNSDERAYLEELRRSGKSE